MTFSTIQLFTPAGLQTIKDEKPDTFKCASLGEPITIYERKRGCFKDFHVTSSLENNHIVQFIDQDQNIVEKLNVKQDEIITFNRLYYVNPLLNLDEKILYIGIQHQNEMWMKLSFSFSSLIRNELDEILNLDDYPSLSSLNPLCDTFQLAEKNKKMHIQLKIDYDFDDREIISECQEYKGVFFSQSQEEVDAFLLEKRLAQNERRSALYTHFIENMEQELTLMQNSLSSEENKQHLANVLKVLKQ